MSLRILLKYFLWLLFLLLYLQWFLSPHQVYCTPISLRESDTWQSSTIAVSASFVPAALCALFGETHTLVSLQGGEESEEMSIRGEYSARHQILLIDALPPEVMHTALRFVSVCNRVHYRQECLIVVQGGEVAIRRERSLLLKLVLGAVDTLVLSFSALALLVCGWLTWHAR